MKNLILLILLGSMFAAQAQIRCKPQLFTGLDLYQWYRNPESNLSPQKESSSGTAILAFPLGVKLGVGNAACVISVEASANLGLFSLDTRHYKGLGAIAFPVLLKANFGSMTGLNYSKILGFAFGGGLQYSRTELYGTSLKYENLHRDFFKTYVGEINVGAGLGGFNLSYYLRIGLGEDKSFSLNNGIICQIQFFHDTHSK